VTYLTIFDCLFDIPRDKKNFEYRTYLQSLVDYLVDYAARVKPLMDVDSLFHHIEQDFEKEFAAGTFQGWPVDLSLISKNVDLLYVFDTVIFASRQKEPSGSALTSTGAPLDLSAFSCAEELATLGLDRLKSALMGLGLKCGGTLEDRAQRLFSTKGLQLHEIDPALKAKGQGKGKDQSKNKDNEKHKKIALLEAQVYK